jgi:hypothetical protein
MDCPDKPGNDEVDNEKRDGIDWMARIQGP